MEWERVTNMDFGRVLNEFETMFGFDTYSFEQCTDMLNGVPDFGLEAESYVQYDSEMDHMTIHGVKHSIFAVAEFCYGKLNIVHEKRNPFFQVYTRDGGQFIAMGMGLGETVSEINRTGFIRACYAAVSVFGIEEARLYMEKNYDFTTSTKVDRYMSQLSKPVISEEGKEFVCSCEDVVFPVVHIGKGVSAKEALTECKLGMAHKMVEGMAFDGNICILCNECSDFCKCTVNYLYHDAVNLCRVLTQQGKKLFKNLHVDKDATKLELEKIFSVKSCVDIYHQWSRGISLSYVTIRSFHMSYLTNKAFFDFANFVFKRMVVSILKKNDDGRFEDNPKPWFLERKYVRNIFTLPRFLQTTRVRDGHCGHCSSSRLCRYVDCDEKFLNGVVPKKGFIRSTLGRLI